MKHMKYIARIALVLLTLMFVADCKATVITPPTSIQLDGGNEVNGIWKGGYWTFTCAVDQADSLIGNVILPVNTTKAYDNGTKIETRKTVEIDITPTKAYYKRTLRLMDIDDRIVSPATYFGGLNYLGFGGYDTSKGINPVVVNTYTWAEQGWQKYTIFTVTIEVDGQTIGQTTLNTEQGINSIVIPTSKGNVLIKNLGRLEGDYTEPQTAIDIVIFDNRYIYSGDALRYIRYDHGRTWHYWITDRQYVTYIEDSEAFSTYWWGTCRWNPNANIDDSVKSSPAPFKFIGGTTGFEIADPTKGWKAEDYFGGLGRMPVLPNIFPDNGSDSLIEYLNMKTSGGNIAKTWLQGYNDWHFEYQNGQPSAVVVDLPWGAYSGSPIVTFYIPSELADTWVYHPPIANVKIDKAEWTNGNDIKTNATCRLTLHQESTITSSTVITAKTDNRATVTPRSITLTMQPNTIQTIDFQVSNLGVTDDTSGQVSFIVTRSWDGQQTDSTTLSYTLKKPEMPKNITDVTDRTSDVVDKNKQNTTEHDIPEDKLSNNKTQDKIPYIPDKTPENIPRIVLLEHDTPWLLITIIACGTAILLATIVAIYKSKAVKKKDVQTTLAACGRLGKTTAKEGMKMSKALWRSSPIVRAFAGLALGLTLMGLSFMGLPAIFGTINLLFITVSVLNGILFVFGAFVTMLCFTKIFLSEPTIVKVVKHLTPTEE